MSTAIRIIPYSVKSLYLDTKYSVNYKNTGTDFCHNLIKCWPIFPIFHGYTQQEIMTNWSLGIDVYLTITLVHPISSGRISTPPCEILISKHYTFIVCPMQYIAWDRIQDSPADARVIPIWPSAAILDFIEPQIAPFDPIPKILAQNQTWSVSDAPFVRYSPLNSTILWPWNLGSGSLKVIENGTIR